MPNGTVHVQGPDGKHYAFGPQSGVTDEATARAWFQKNGVGWQSAPNPLQQQVEKMKQTVQGATGDPNDTFFGSSAQRIADTAEGIGRTFQPPTDAGERAIDAFPGM